VKIAARIGRPLPVARPFCAVKGAAGMPAGDARVVGQRMVAALDRSGQRAAVDTGRSDSTALSQGLPSPKTSAWAIAGSASRTDSTHSGAMLRP
jgi:hypothetical protein